MTALADSEYPRIRMRLCIIVAMPPDGDGSITVSEQKHCVSVEIAHPIRADARIALTIPEARRLADHLNTICRRIVSRPKGRP